MLELFWREMPVPENLRIRQVYGVPFSSDGKILLKVENKGEKKIYSLAGGTPENIDKDTIATLYREFIEEVNTTLCEPIYLGFQEVRGDGEKEPYAQVRMACLIKEIGEKKPDPDDGKTYDRVLASPEKVKQLLNWGEIGRKIIDCAVNVAKEKYHLQFDGSNDEIFV